MSFVFKLWPHVIVKKSLFVYSGIVEAFLKKIM